MVAFKWRENQSHKKTSHTANQLQDQLLYSFKVYTLNESKLECTHNFCLIIIVVGVVVVVVIIAYFKAAYKWSLPL